MTTPAPPRKHRPNIAEELHAINDELFSSLNTHEPGERLMNRRNVAEVLADLGGTMKKILQVLERLAPPPSWNEFLQSQSQKET